jgi:membrane protein YdbS with pleckstrin-like domain
MPLLGQVLIALLIISLICTYLAFRVRDWRFGVVAALLALPIGEIAQDPYDSLLILPTLQLVAAIALRWNASPRGWLGLLLLGATVWLVCAAGPYLWHWPLAAGFAYLAVFCVGIAALIWRQSSWSRARRPSIPGA